MKRMRFLSLLLAVVLVASTLLTVALAPRPAGAQTPLSLSWRGFYWDNRNFAGNPKIARTDFNLNFNWGPASPDPAIPADNFSARWYADVNVTQAGAFVIRAGADDGIRVAVDGAIVYDRFFDSPTFQINQVTVNLGVGPHQIIVDYFEGGGNAGVLVEVIPQTGVIGNVQLTPTPGGTLAPGATIQPGSTGPVKVVVIVNKANVRSGPGTRFAQIGEVIRDQQFVVLARNGPFGLETWFLVDLGDGRRGWLYRRVVYPYGGNPESLPSSQEEVGGTTSESNTIVIVTGVAKTNVVIRSAPSTRVGERIGAIERGGTFTILQLSTNRAWVKIDYQGLVGWVFLPNVRVLSGKLGSLPRGNN